MNVYPPESANNAVEVNESDYTINGTTTIIGADDTYGNICGIRYPYPYSGNANGSNVIFNSGIAGAIYGGFSYYGDASKNTITIKGGTIDNVYGGFTMDAEGAGVVQNNTINIKGGTIYFISGGYANSEKSVSGNTINIDSGEIMGSVLGGQSADGNAIGNIINISGGNFYGRIYGGVANFGTATNNAINIEKSPNLNASTLYGSDSSTSSDNTLNIKTKGLTAKNIGNFQNMNFYLDGNISNGDTILTLTDGNQTDLSDTDVKAVVQSGFSLTDGNSVNLLVNDAGITDAKSKTVEVQEGVSYTYTTSLALSDDSKSLLFKVGDSTGDDDNNDDDDNNNDDDNNDDDNNNDDNNNNDNNNDDDTTTDDSNKTVNLTGGSTDNTYGGYTTTGNASNNTVNWYSGTYSNIYGGYAPSGSTSNNTLNVYNKNLSAQNLYNFDSLNFYIPNDASNGDTMVTLTDSNSTDLSGVAIRAGVVSGNSNLAAGDTINLLTNSNGFITDSATTYGTLTEGVSLNYGLTISNSGSNILATIDSISANQTLNSQTQSIPLSAGLTSIKTLDTVLDNNNLPAIGLDFDFENYNSNGANSFESDSEDNATSQEAVDVPIVEPKGWEIFASMGGGSLKTKAGDGAYVDMKSTSFDLGIARTLDNGGAGKLAFAPIIDYAHGNYDSYLADGTHGTGSTRYIAGGGIFRNMWDSGLYLEGSFRIGKIKNDFSSNDMDKTFGQRVSYDTDATAMAGHLKIGKNLRLNKNNLLDVYATYYHSHQGGMNADLAPYGDKYHISSANSGRMKIGYRLTTRTSKISRIYTGLAYQYEHTGGITANYLSKNLSTKSAGNSGSSGMLELGWQIKPLKNNPWAVDINATGWVGHQRGVTATAKIQKSF